MTLARLGIPWLALCLIASPAAAAQFQAGGFVFSDEMGGFRLLSVTGSGSKSDPIVVVEEFRDILPVTLVIRRLEPVGDAQPYQRNGIWTAIHLRKVIKNATGRVWRGFDIELQEVLHRPSTYGDGLSFDQGAVSPENALSDRFGSNLKVYEPADRIRFENGHVDPGGVVNFIFHITDPTPVDTFFIVQDPVLLFSMGPPWRRFVAVPHSVHKGSAGHGGETAKRR